MLLRVSFGCFHLVLLQINCEQNDLKFQRIFGTLFDINFFFGVATVFF